MKPSIRPLKHAIFHFSVMPSCRDTSNWKFWTKFFEIMQNALRSIGVKCNPFGSDLCKKSSNLELSQSISVLEDSGMSSAGSKKSSCVSGAANSHSHHPVKSSSDSKLAKSAAAAAGGASLNVNVDSLHHHHHHHHHHHYYLSQPGVRIAVASNSIHVVYNVYNNIRCSFWSYIDDKRNWNLIINVIET